MEFHPYLTVEHFQPFLQYHWFNHWFPLGVFRAYLCVTVWSKVPPAEADTPSNSKHAKVLKTRAEHLVLKTQKKAAKAGQLVMSAVNSAVNSAANTPLGSPMNSPRTRRRNNNNRLAVPPAVAATVAAAAAEMSPIKAGFALDADSNIYGKGERGFSGVTFTRAQKKLSN